MQFFFHTRFFVSGTFYSICLAGSVKLVVGILSGNPFVAVLFFTAKEKILHKFCMII